MLNFNKFTLFIILLLGSFSSFSQIKISTEGSKDQAHTSAALEVESSNKGFLLPRVDSLKNIQNPVGGLVVYLKSDSSLYIYEKSAWRKASGSYLIELLNLINQKVSIMDYNLDKIQIENSIFTTQNNILNKLNDTSSAIRTNLTNSISQTERRLAQVIMDTSLEIRNDLDTKLAKIDTASLSRRINTKLTAMDTASLSNRINLKANQTALIDSTIALRSAINNISLEVLDTTYLSRRINQRALQTALIDTSRAIRNDLGDLQEDVDVFLNAIDNGASLETAALKVIIADTARNLRNDLNTKLTSSDTASLSRRIDTKLSAVDTASLSNRINQRALQTALVDTSVAIRNDLGNLQEDVDVF
ncbi:MAG: hypothetical protein RIR51_592, partial [Bacteroidota bacterium]